MQAQSSGRSYSVSFTESPLTGNNTRAGLDGAHITSTTWSQDPDKNGQETYPFRNFWSQDGNIDEVLFALPSKQRADVLLDAFFEHITPLYPIVSENSFRSRFEEFWILSANERTKSNATWVALQFIIFASGHLYVHDPTAADFTSISETYISCCYRALCLASFLSEWSLETIQVLILICNYFVTSSRTADCWTFSGILQKIVYGLELHHPPAAGKSMSERHLRYALWQAFMFQDVSLSYFLELVPASCHHTIDVSLFRVGEGVGNDLDSRLRAMLSWEQGDIDIAFLSSQTDVAYQRAMWRFSKFMQTHICLPSALGKPIAKSVAHKAMLIAELQDIYNSLDAPFNVPDFRSGRGRLWRQTVMIANNYNFAFSMLHLARNPSNEVSVDWRGALKSSNKALSAFFSLVNQDRQYLTMWTPINTRAYAQTLMVCKVLSTAKEQRETQDDPWLQLAVGNYERYVDLLTHAHGSWAFEQKKVEYLSVLSDYRELSSAAL